MSNGGDRILLIAPDGTVTHNATYSAADQEGNDLDPNGRWNKRLGPRFSTHSGCIRRRHTPCDGHGWWVRGHGEHEWEH